MENKNIQKILLLLAAVFVVLGFLFMFGKGCSFSGGSIRKTDTTIMPEATNATERIGENIIVEQSFRNTTETISKLGVVFTRIQYLEGPVMVIELLDGDKTLGSTVIRVELMEEQHRIYIEPSFQITGVKDKVLTLRVYGQEGKDTGLALMYAEVGGSSFKFGHNTVKGTICFYVEE